MAAPHQRHQISLQGFENPSRWSSPPLTEDARLQASERFHQIVEHFTSSDQSTGYNRPRLVGLVYRYATSSRSQDNVLRSFFRAVELPMKGPAVDFSDEARTEILRSHVAGFAEHLVNNFFMPLRALTARTRSATLRSSSRDSIGTPERLSTLRSDCLIRDRHRCVISRAFDMSKARQQKDPQGHIFDDEGDPIEDDNINWLEVAHILPHSLVYVGSESEELYAELTKSILELETKVDAILGLRLYIVIQAYANFSYRCQAAAEHGPYQRILPK
ncbi:hypothetical protein IF1G_00065 [Cordyceps javanica]|uniref:HNH nuclease domain-containing protein n=1 Tax=Cordyceps javanica TaxID=43265 RepID=A0A545VEI2_9HYPO|nr:hypothetical protein IF1G_00065 [Cordyceps javanica]TQW11333.1 HNH endonuclease domain-containing protein [Cordyceps javanica]